MSKSVYQAEIFLFGELKILINGEDITQNIKHSPKKLMLLEYLLVNKNRLIPTSNLIDVLWNGKDDFSLEGTLRTLVSRLRKELLEHGLENAILSKKGTYTWNPDLDCKIDIFYVEDLCNKVDEITNLTPNAVAIFEDILYMYRDHLLSNSSLNPWLTPKVYYYHNLYLKSIYAYIELLKAGENLSEVIRVCKIALEIDPFDTTLNLELMQSLLNQGKNREALSQYQNVTDLHFNHLGTKPSDEILDFYKKLITVEKPIEANIDDILQELRNVDSYNGALVCEYSIFKDIYRLYLRNLKRLNIKMFLAIVNLRTLDADPDAVDPFEMDKAMKNLRNLLQINLRTGDTISRYSPNQFTLILPSIETYEAGRMVMKRVQSFYYSFPENSKFKLNFHIVELVD